MQINKHGSFYIRNGWPTKIIDAINNDKYIFSPNKEIDAVDNIGVGRVMIKAMRYWSTVLGISDESKSQQGVVHTLTTLGKQISRFDMYCQDIGTLWLLHRNLTCNLEASTCWTWAFNTYNDKSFTKDDFTSAFYSYLQRNGENYNRNAVEKEFDCFKNTYVSDKAFDLNKIIDENTIPFFTPLKLIEYTGSGRFEKRKSLSKDIPLDILLFCILADNSEHLKNSSEIDIDTLLEGSNQVGKYMNLGYSTLLELLQQLENKDTLSLINNFGNRYIHIKNANISNIIPEYYQNL